VTGPAGGARHRGQARKAPVVGFLVKPAGGSSLTPDVVPVTQGGSAVAPP
jgi:hypothetical protein